VDTWRCPTCLCVLRESDTKRCPTCQSKLRKRRGRPFVLGETSLLDAQATLPIVRQNRTRDERSYWNPERPAPVPQTVRPAWIHLTHPAPEPVAFVEPEPEPEPETVFVEPAPEAVLVPAEPEPVPWFDEPDFERDAFAHTQPSRRSLRLMAPPSSNRRRWNVGFDRRRGDDV